MLDPGTETCALYMFFRYELLRPWIALETLHYFSAPLGRSPAGAVFVFIFIFVWF